MPSGELSDTRRLGSADARWYTSQGEKAVFRRQSIALRTMDAARGTAAEDVKVFVGGVEAAGRGGFLPPKQTGAQFMGKPY